MNIFQECRKYPGRLRDLCEGRGREGRGDPPLYAVNAFRAERNLAALSDNPEVRVQQLIHDSQEQVEDDVAPLPKDDSISLNGPGHQLELIFTELQVPYRENCTCRAYAHQMDVWGVAGCREHFDEIVNRLRENAMKYSLWEHIKSAARAVSNGLAFQLNPFDPFPGLVAEAIRRTVASTVLLSPHVDCSADPSDRGGSQIRIE